MSYWENNAGFRFLVGSCEKYTVNILVLLSKTEALTFTNRFEKKHEMKENITMVIKAPSSFLCRSQGLVQIDRIEDFFIISPCLLH